MSCTDDELVTASDCSPCSPGVRNRYFRGKLMTVADYEAEQRYSIERRRLINRQMLGWGVVSGFAVERPEAGMGDPYPGISVGSGLALDPRGREVAACEPVRLRWGEDVVWLRKVSGTIEVGEPPFRPASAEAPGRQPTQPGQAAGAPATGKTNVPGAIAEPQKEYYLLCAHYAERRVDGVVVADHCDEHVCETNRLCETVVYSLRFVGNCPDGLVLCPPSRWRHETLDPAAAEWQAIGNAVAGPAAPGDRGPHLTLAEWSVERSEGNAMCGEIELTCLHEGLMIDPAAGVPLACVTIARECDKTYIAAVPEPLGPRRLACPNPVLFDLIRGCDLTRIDDVSWRSFIKVRRASFEDFAKMFIAPANEEAETVDTNFWVRLTGPVRAASIVPDAITFTLLHWDTDAAVRYYRRMPVARIQIARRSPEDPPGTTRMFRPVVDYAFWDDQIRSRGRAFNEPEGTLVEIGIRGGMIIDARGQLLAAGGAFLPTRPGWPGSDFISAFIVDAPRPKAGKAQEQQKLR